MKRVILQAGHSDRFPPFAAGGGGAPGEAAWAADLCTRIAARLTRRGVEVDLVGAWLVYRNGVATELAAPLEAMAHADLFVSAHYDASGVYAQNTGCFAGRAALDPMGAEADRFIAIWEGLYPAATGIPLHKERLNPNVTAYYGFKATSEETPGVLLEHGIGMGDDHALLFDHLDLVAATDALAITQFLGLEDEDDVTLREELQAVTAERDQLNGIATDLGNQLANKDRLLQEADKAAGAWQEEAQKRQQRIEALQREVVDPLQEKLEALKRQLDLAGHRAARSVLVTYDDGQAQAFAPAPRGG